jgi:hypothetical protein
MTRLGEETVPEGEAEAIAKVLAVSEALLDRTEKPVRRGQHPKHHGCIKAEFAVEPEGMPAECRVGLFAERRTYPALIRFSNGAQQDDRQADAHGMAIKLLGVPGRKILDDEVDASTHDFVLVDNPVFFLANALQYGAFSSALGKAKGKLPSLTYGSLFFLPGKLRELGTVALLYFLPFRIGGLGKLAKFVSKRIANPLQTRYWSTTSYGLGEGRAVKYSATPETVVTEPPQTTSANYLREAMVSVLDEGAATFVFGVQVQTDAASMPVEDPTVEWDDSRAPVYPAARIVIPAQKFDTEASQSACENLSFTPWHALPEHRPLGGINRTRKVVYQAMSRLRHTLNGVPRHEPAG